MRWRNNNTGQRQMETSLCCGNWPQWPLKTEEEEEFKYLNLLSIDMQCVITILSILVFLVSNNIISFIFFKNILKSKLCNFIFHVAIINVYNYIMY